MQTLYHFRIVTSQLCCNVWCNFKMSFTETKLHQYDCCGDLILQFVVGQLCVDLNARNLNHILTVKII